MVLGMGEFNADVGRRIYTVVLRMYTVDMDLAKEMLRKVHC